MKQETLKKIVELADGFEISIYRSFEFIHYKGDSCRHRLTDVVDWIHYPLLLRRAVEGWNDKDEPYDIDLQNTSIYYWGKDDYELEYNYSDYPKTEYLTPQEQAIEGCLIELLEK